MGHRPSGAARAISKAPLVVSRRRAVVLSALLPLLPVFVSPAGASLTASDNKYDGYASTYDDLDDGQIAKTLGMADQRRAAVSLARGKTLEVGVGTGINLQYYVPERLQSLSLIDLSPGMLAQARRKRIGSGTGMATVPTSFVVGNAEELPFEDATFDSVVDTFSMCVYENPQRALSEMARVLKPGGTLLLLEHSKSKSVPLLGAYQDLTAGPAASLGGKGCVYNQDVDGLISNVGTGALQVVERVEFLGGLIVSYVLIRSNLHGKK